MKENLKKALQIFRGGHKEVAERAGIHPNNVGRVLNGEFNNELVIAKVKEVIKERIERAQELLEQAAA
ncbi:MAG: hypothetical protein AAFZ15_04310 [Bacteroidota bacterium]